MKFTGERYIPTEQGRIRLEHQHRYAIALDVAAGKDVLDVACGEGYGSAVLADVARSVVGVDISEAAVSHASVAYKKSNLAFRQGSATSLSFADATFDVVVSFETIEHLTEQERMVAEIKRVLRPDGVLVISSPNRPIYSEESGEQNEFHVKELDFKEFDDLLKVQFPLIQYLGQRMLMGSVIQSLDTEQDAYRAWRDDGVRLKSGSGQLIDPVYFVAVCGKGKTPLPNIDMSVLYPEKLDLVKRYEGIAKWAQTLEEESTARLEWALQLHAELEKERARRFRWASRLKARLKKEKARLEAITSRFLWRLKSPISNTCRCLAAPKQLATRYAKVALRLGKRTYLSLPLSYQTKAAHRHVIARHFPKLFSVLSGSGNHSTTIQVIPLPALTQSMPARFSTPTDFAKSIELPVSRNPQISIIIPIYGQIEYTLRCLASIATHAPYAAFEVIVVEDCSPDESFKVLSHVNGIKLIRNEQNQGFIRSCNAGARVANGEYLYFLNNDTEVTPGWLDELLRTFHEFPGTGLAGSKLIYPDGRLQEAGGIIWKDGSAWNFGRYQDPLLPAYNYAREVDYCSGASIMVPKNLFDQLDGFDEHYLPAYGEDSDLALKIRAKGCRVIYQPLSTVIHCEGITSGTDTTQGAKSYQIENGKKLFERWQYRLQAHQAPGEEADNAKDRRASRRALVIDHCTPTPNQDAGGVTVFNLILLLREMNFQVTFVAEDNFLYVAEYTGALQRAGVEVLYAPYVTSLKQHLKEYGKRYDLALLFRPAVVENNLKTIRKFCPKAKVLFHTADLHFLRMSREAALQSDKAKQKAADEMRRRELAAIRDTDSTIVHSSAELELLRPLVPGAKINVFPLIMDLKGTSKTFAERKDIVFVGGYQHAPNVDAVHYFVTEIMPLLRKQLPRVRFYAAGSKPPADMQALAAKDVIITGFIEDLTSFLDKMRVSVAPLRFGAGIKGKIGSAMVVGLPVVATTLATEGMSLSIGENVLVADDALAFANTITKIYQDEVLWDHISQNGLAFADKAWGAETAWRTLAAIVTELGFSVERDAYPLSLYAEATGPEASPRVRLSLEPIASVKNRKAFEEFLQDNLMGQFRKLEKQLLDTAKSEVFAVPGFCVPCDRKVSLLVDMQSGGQRLAKGWIPNWRERLECPLCKMSNRQRLIATLVNQELNGQGKKHVYFMEQVTPIYYWAVATFKNHSIVGSEYLGYEYEGGTVIKGIRHEDVENLSFQNGSLDIIVSNDVFEHVPNPAKAFAECARVLKDGGVMLASIPFHSSNNESVTRARIIDGNLENLLAPSYHGNPISEKGSLVFTDFGWDLLDVIKASGFSDVSVNVYASTDFGHLGGGQIIFRGER